MGKRDGRLSIQRGIPHCTHPVVGMEIVGRTVAIHVGVHAKSHQPFTGTAPGRNKLGNMRCPMEVCTGLEPSTLVIRHMPLCRYKNFKSIDEEQCYRITNIEKMHDALEQIHKEVSNSNQRQRVQSQKVHNARTNVLALRIYIGDGVMIRSHSKKIHKLQQNWRGPM